MGIKYFHNILFLACLLTQNRSESTCALDNENLLSWAAPRDFQVKFPYYFTGYDDHGSPVYMGEFGKWNYMDELAKGPAHEEVLEKHIVQLHLRVLKEGADAPGGVGSVLIVDLSNFKSDSRVLEFFGKIAQNFNEINKIPGLKVCYVINANKEYMDVYEKVKPYFAPLGNRFQVYGEDATKWNPEVLKYLQVDQTRLGVNSEPVSPFKEILNSKIPQEVPAQYVYYLSGYSKQGQPVFIVPVGQWDFRAAVEKGAVAVHKLGKFHDQMALRWNREGIDAPCSPGSIVIMDVKGFDQRQTSHNETFNFILDLMRRGDTTSRSSGIAHFHFINNNPEFEKVYRVGKANLKNLYNNGDIFGEDPNEWMPILLKEISPDQLPEEYGGLKEYRPLKIYGTL